MRTAAIILAAGSASRMQRPDQAPVPKMLLPYRQKTLLQLVLDAVIQSGVHPIVVTGCFHDEIETILKGQDIESIRNEHWASGMGTSIGVGVTYLLQQHPEVQAVFILLADQPGVDASLLTLMLTEMERTGKQMVACRYSDTEGTPVVFGRKYLEALRACSGQQGAKQLLKTGSTDLALVEFPAGSLDIDTPGDYAQLIRPGSLIDPIPPNPGG